MLNAEADLEILELHLDGALDPAELAALHARLKSDTALAGSLAELKSERAIRIAAWESMQGDAAAAGRLQWRIRSAVYQQDKSSDIAAPVRTNRFWGQWNISRVGSAAAACLVIGFLAGRAGQSGRSTPVQRPIAPPSEVNIAQADPLNTDPHFTPVAVKSSANDNTGPYSVPITDSYGRTVTVQRFATAEEARNFGKDLEATHSPAGAPVQGPSKLASEEKVPF